jgi:hypothetical protein
MATERIHPPEPGFKPEEYKIRGRPGSEFANREGNRIAEVDRARRY